MYIYVIIALLFGAGVIYNLFQVPRDWADINGGLGMVACMIFMYLWILWNFRRRHQTLRWLRDHKDEITDEERFFRGSPFPDKAISKQTRMRNFKAVTSLIFFTTIHDVGGDLRGGIFRGFIATAWTLVFGWWAIPWGPIRTIQALVTNLSGGEKDTVSFAMNTADAALKLEGGESGKSR